MRFDSRSTPSRLCSGVHIRFSVLNPRSASADVISKHANVSLIANASCYSYVHWYTCRVEKHLVQYSIVTNANSPILNLSFKIARNGSRLIYATKAI